MINNRPNLDADSNKTGSAAKSANDEDETDSIQCTSMYRVVQKSKSLPNSISRPNSTKTCQQS